MGQPSEATDAVADATQDSFSLEETGIQTTAETAVTSDDGEVANGSSMTQSIDLDVLVPDDGDADGDSYNLTINPSQARANDIDVIALYADV